MDTSPEKYCQALACVYQTMMNEMKSSIPLWEDFAAKCAKLQSALKVSLLALGAFLDAFQKLADLSMNSKGGSRELGSSLTRLCMRQRTVEAKLKMMSASLVDQLANPVLEKVEEWKRNAVAIDKERTRDYKKARQEVKRASMDTLRMQKKVRKTSGAGVANSGSSSMASVSGNARSFSNAPMGTLPRDGGAVAQAQLEYAMHDVCARWTALQEAEQCSLRKVMREERARFCFFITCFKPIIDQEVSLLSEMTCFQEIAEKLAQQSADVNTLPSECEQLLTDLRDSPELLLKSFSQSQSSLSLSQVQLHAGAALTTNADSVSLGSGCASDTHSPSAGSSSASVSACADSNSNPNLLAGAPNDATSTNLESTNERHAHTNSHAAVALMRRESIASVGSETLLRRASQKNGPQHATTALHHCATDCSSNLLHASVVSMSTNSLVSNVSRSSCSSVGATGHPQHVTLNSLPKSALTGVSSSSAASALLCVAAATRNAAAAKTTSQDSGFISQDTLYAACSGGRVIPPNTGASAQGGRDKRASAQAQAEDGIIWMQKDDSPESALETFENYIGQVARQLGDMTDDLPPSRSDSPSHGSSASPVSTWTNWPEQPGYFDPKVLNAQLQARPYTVSAPGASGTRKPHRPPLNEKMFEPPASLASEAPCANAYASASDPKPAKVPPPVPTKCPALHENNSQCHYAAPAPFTAQQTRDTITEDSFEHALQNNFNLEDPECTLTKFPAVADEDFPAPPSADILQRIVADCVQVTHAHSHVLQRGDTVDMLPLPPPPSDYADPTEPQSSPATDSNATPAYTPKNMPTPGVVRSLASESSPISKLIQQLSAKGDRSRNDDQTTAGEQLLYAAVSNGQPIYSTSNMEQVYAAPANSTTTMRQSRPEQCEYAQTGVRHSSRSRPAPPQRRSSVQIGAVAQQMAPPSAPIRPLPGNKLQYQSPPNSAGVEYHGLPLGMASQSSLPAVPNWNGTGIRQLPTAGGQSRVGVMQVVAMPVDIQPSSGSLTSQAPLAVPIPAVRMSLGGIAACPPELNEHAGAILRQIKNGVNLRHCSASLINDKSRPLLRF